jgi:hypothetical protein
MSYTLNYYGSNANAVVSGGTPASAITVPDGQSQTLANLTFPGRNFSGYGSPVDQNFLSLAENFASSNTSGPGNPVIGQLWYDTANAKSNTASGNLVSGLKVKTGVHSADGNIAGQTIKAGDPKWEMIATKSDDGSLSIGNVLTVAANANVSGNVNVVGNVISNNITANSNITSLNANFTTSLVTPSANISSGKVVANSSGLRVTNGNSNVSISSDNVVFSGSTSWFTANSTGINITVPVNIENTLNFKTGGSTTPTPLVSSGQIITVGAGSTANTAVNAYGLDFSYYVNTGGAFANRRDAFMGWMAPSWTFTSGDTVSAGEFVFASSISNANIASNTNPTVTDIVLGNLRALTYKGSSVDVTNLYGALSNKTATNSNVTVNSGNVTLNVSGNSPLVATSTYVKITGNSASGNGSGALQVAGNASVTGNLYVSGGNIYGTVIAPAGSTANIPTANITTINGSTGNITTLNATTINTNSTATINTLNVNTAATVNSLTANSGITVSGSSTFSGGVSISGTNQLTVANISTGATGTSGVLTGQWTLGAGSTLEATYSADLAERHHADAAYPTGTVMTVGGTNEITAANENSKVLGVVSDQWAYLMNGGAGPQETHPAVAYVGRVPVRVVGPVNKHDEVSPFKNGVATASRSNSFGWALETNLEAGEKLVLCIVK